MPGFIHDFMEYSTSVCESPIHFHQWAGFWALSVACGRRIYMPMHDITLYPNLYVVLVGPSGYVQKSSAGRVAMRLLREIGIDVHKDSITVAYIRDHMRELSRKLGRAEMALFVSEMRTALNEQSIKDGIVENLTNMWDCDEGEFKSTKTSGRLIIPNVWFATLMCSTREWLTTGLRTDEVGGGFAGRLVIMYGSQPYMIMPYARVSPTAKREARTRALTHLKDVCRLEGAFTLESDAAALWDSYRKHLHAERDEVDARVQPFHSRAHVHILKFAMLEALSERCELRVCESDMVSAIDMFEDVIPMMKEALRGVAKTRHSSSIDRIMTLIRRRGGELTRGELQRMLHANREALPVDELDTLLNSMAATGLITRELVQVHVGKRAREVLTLVKGGHTDANRETQDIDPGTEPTS